MQVSFRTAQLQQAYEQHAEAVRHWGEKTARRFVQRIEILQAAKSADDLFKFPSLRFHPLAAERKGGGYSLVLNGKVRLVVTFADSSMTTLWIEEVSNHYE